MSRSPTWLSLLALLVVAILVAACAGTTPSTAPSGSPTATQGTESEPPESMEPFEGTQYPEDGSSACGGEGYNGIIGSIKALDRYSVEFTLCQPDAAFLSKVA